MPLFQKRVKVTKEQFAEVLGYWIAKQLKREQVEETAKLFGMDTSNKKDLTLLVEELFDLNMWLVVHTCERVFTDTRKRDECLDIFHHLVHDRLGESEEMSFDQWILNLSEKYMDYYKAREAKHELGPMWELSTVVNRNLFEKLNLSAFVQFAIGAYIKSTIDALEGALKQYKIS